MKLKLVEYPFGKQQGFEQDKMYFILGQNESGDYCPWIWNEIPTSLFMYNTKTLEDAIKATRPEFSYTDFQKCCKDFNRIKIFFEEQKQENIIKTLKEIEV